MISSRSGNGERRCAAADRFAGVPSSRVDALPWSRLHAQLDERGFAVAPALLTAAECIELASLYDDDDRFRSRVVMARHGFGRGEYRYFDDPLPDSSAA